MALRYSDEELKEFRTLIEKKLAEAEEQLDLLENQITDTTENSNDDHGGDWVDDSAYSMDLEMLNNMANRQKKYIADLKAALVRISAKTYGVCMNTGELIDKRRLMAVPTTTKSLAAKGEEQKTSATKGRNMPKRPYIKSKEKKVTSVVKKSSKPKSAPLVDDFDDDDDDYMMDDAVGDVSLDDIDDPIDEDSYDD